MMTESMLKDRIDGAYEQSKPFLLYCFPGERVVNGCFKLGSARSESTGEGSPKFRIVSFLSDVDMTFDLQHVVHSDISSAARAEDRAALSDKGKEAHIELVATALDSIDEGQFDKVVLSRNISVKLKEFRCSILYQYLFAGNQNCLRYIWFHPEHGLWAGATPEVLLEVAENTAHTMSLAGTRLKGTIAEVPFSDKEREEQQFVTDMILDTLSDLTSEVTAGPVELRSAGDLVHLYTPIKAELLPSVSPSKLAEALHPTPAVCGLPRDEARQFIIDNESYEREFYTGFLGFISGERQSSKFFVNLRCMKIEQDVATLYAGGGITERSVPVEEWEETQNKLGTMTKVLSPFL